MWEFCSCNLVRICKHDAERRMTSLTLQPLQQLLVLAGLLGAELETFYWDIQDRPSSLLIHFIFKKK